MFGVYLLFLIERRMQAANLTKSISGAMDVPKKNCKRKKAGSQVNYSRQPTVTYKLVSGRQKK